MSDTFLGFEQGFETNAPGKTEEKSKMNQNLSIQIKETPNTVKTVDSTAEIRKFHAINF